MTVSSRVSAIIPYYNSKDTIKRAVRSALGQDYPNVEIIVVDDASDEDIEGLLNSLNSSIHYIRLNKNSGPATARNIGVQSSSGEYLAFLDADDEWLPEHLRTQIKWMNEFPQVGFSFCNALNRSLEGRTYNLFERNSTVIALLERKQLEEDIYLITKNLSGAIIRSNIIFTPTVVTRRNFWNSVGEFEVRLRGPEDIHMWVRMALRSPAIMINKPGIIRYLRREGLTLQGEKWYREFLKALDFIEGEIHSNSFTSICIRNKRRNVFASLIRWQGRQGYRSRAWKDFQLALNRCGFDYYFFVALVYAMTGGGADKYYKLFQIVGQRIWGKPA